MKIMSIRQWVLLFSAVGFVLGSSAEAADTCIFQETADDIPPAILLLMDNGAASEHVLTPPAYDPSEYFWVDKSEVLGGAYNPNDPVATNNAYEKEISKSYQNFRDYLDLKDDKRAYYWEGDFSTDTGKQDMRRAWEADNFVHTQLGKPLGTKYPGYPGYVSDWNGGTNRYIPHGTELLFNNKNGYAVVSGNFVPIGEDLNPNTAAGWPLAVKSADGLYGKLYTPMRMILQGIGDVGRTYDSMDGVFYDLFDAGSDLISTHYAEFDWTPHVPVEMRAKGDFAKFAVGSIVEGIDSGATAIVLGYPIPGAVPKTTVTPNQTRYTYQYYFYDYRFSVSQSYKHPGFNNNVFFGGKSLETYSPGEGLDSFNTRDNNWYNNWKYPLTLTTDLTYSNPAVGPYDILAPTAGKVWYQTCCGTPFPYRIADLWVVRTSAADFKRNSDGQIIERVRVKGDTSIEAPVARTYNYGKNTGVWIPLAPKSGTEVINTSTGEAIADGAAQLRFSSNFLNWLHFDFQWKQLGQAFYLTGQNDNLVGDGKDGVSGDYLIDDHSTLFLAKRAIMESIRLTQNKAKFGILSFGSGSGGGGGGGTDCKGQGKNGCTYTSGTLEYTTNAVANVQPLKSVLVDTSDPDDDPSNDPLDPNVKSAFSTSMKSQSYSPLALGIAELGGLWDNNRNQSELWGGETIDYPCQKLFNLVVSPGLSSADQPPLDASGVPKEIAGLPATLEDFDQNDVEQKEGFEKVVYRDKYGIERTFEGYFPVGKDGNTFADDITYYQDNHDIVTYREGDQSVSTFVVGMMPTTGQRLFLQRMAANGNGIDFYDYEDPKRLKFYNEATNPEGLAKAITDAINTILSETSSFTAPVVPVTRTTSGDLIYLSFFKPLNSRLWEGNVTKFGLAEDNTIIGGDGNPATYPNGAMREDAKPIWETKKMSDPSAGNWIGPPAARTVYTFMGASTALNTSGNLFSTSNTAITDKMMGVGLYPFSRSQLIEFSRGADATDADFDTNTTEWRVPPSGDALHSEPMVFSYDDSTRLILYGANDGMLHAVEDTNGKEVWNFIPPYHLHRLGMLADPLANPADHVEYVDSSPRAFHEDLNHNYRVDGAEKVMIVVGERKGGTSYYGLDITDPKSPILKWWLTDRRHDQVATLALDNPLGILFTKGETVTFSSGNKGVVLLGGMSQVIVSDLTGDIANGEIVTNSAGKSATVQVAAPHSPKITADVLRIVPEMGQSWSEPVFGKVRISDDPTDPGRSVLFVGGGYHADNLLGRCILVVDVYTGEIIAKIANGVNGTSGMDYSIVSNINAVDENNNGFIDKLYVGDLGGRLWRVGQFDTDSSGKELVFPDTNENVYTWGAEVLFSTGCDDAGNCGDLADSDGNGVIDEFRRFYYAPDLVLEFGFDVVFIGSGDREAACDPGSNDMIYAIRDDHQVTGLTEADLNDISAGTNYPNLYLGDDGWRFVLEPGEKVLAEGVTFYRVFYITTFVANQTKCTPGGDARLYALSYLTGAPARDKDGDGTAEPYLNIGGGIASKPVVVIREGGQSLLVSVGSTAASSGSDSMGAGIVEGDPDAPPYNFTWLGIKEDVE